MRVKDINKVDIIFKASLDLIKYEGIVGLTMAKLAKKAGIATGTLYIYFKSKEDLLNQLYNKLNKESVNRFVEGYDVKESFMIGFKKIWMNYLRHRIEHYEESVFLEQYYRSPFITKEQKHLAEMMKSPVHAMIQRGKDDGLVRKDADNEMLFLSMLGFIRELGDEHVTDVYKLDKEKIEKAFELSWCTIRT